LIVRSDNVESNPGRRESCLIWARDAGTRLAHQDICVITFHRTGLHRQLPPAGSRRICGNRLRGVTSKRPGIASDESIRPASRLHCCPTSFHYRARPRNAIIARSTSTSCSDVRRPTRAWTFDLLTVVSLSTITSLSWSSPESRPSPALMRIRISGASNSVLVIGAVVTDFVASKRSS